MNKHLKSFARFINELSEKTMMFFGLLFVAAVSIIDYFTGYEFAFSLFYLIPIMFVNWYSTKKAALATAILCAACWGFVDILSGGIHSRFFYIVWNTLILLGFFVVIVHLLSYLKVLLQNERNLARTDFLTSAFNSRHFYEVLECEIHRSNRYSAPFTLVYFDLDNFKELNDRHGHSQGDVFLQEMTNRIVKAIRVPDKLFRLGGDEFALVLPQTDTGQSKPVVEKLQNIINAISKEHGWSVTASIGAVSCNSACNADELLKSTDKIMYSVKNSGKNSARYGDYKPGSCAPL